jgi:hypothetical protein
MARAIIIRVCYRNISCVEDVYIIVFFFQSPINIGYDRL